MIDEIKDSGYKVISIEEYEELKARIEKAIELLENDYFEDGSGENVESVLEILKGSDKE